MGRFRPKRGSPVPLALAALALMLLPSSFSHKPRLWLSLLFVPPRWSASALHDLASRAAASARADEDAVNADHYRNTILHQQEQISDLRRHVENLAAARGVVREPALTLLPAHVVVAADANAWRKSLVLARGSSHGVARGMLVLWQNHLVGRVVETTPWTSRVLLVTDSAFRVGAVAVPRVGDDSSAPLQDRDLGILEGTAGGACILKWLAGEADVGEGAIVVTAPDPDARVPRGLLIGRVAGLSRGRGLYPKVDVAPFLNHRALDSVVIVLGKEP